ncbi:MAG: undecaprenyl-diphosphate phosphatase [Prevotella sp.]|jgi:undecaprenyl-diphosphatase|nr:undecaprenyl-diphosphate phosphatase [Prevotella sp.]MCH4183184.1 undecaprenyl-diphosphate phosphatase [Prevotella sp.]MCH4212861.1 undecaprenyl-diphosphate phosphatase [Prevotella sp.]MCH4241941.1 undecaprenyl-diphosphate phosphatase [Prevotella sp.]
MTLFQTIIISIVEGLTEFLPVSSTGHMLIAENLLGVQNSAFVRAFTIIIQFGAILSVVVLYWKRFFHLDHSPAPVDSNNWNKFKHKWNFYWMLLVAFIPTAAIGLVMKKSGAIDFFLDPAHAIWIVPSTLIAGGIFMLFCDRIFNKGRDENRITEKRAFWVGVIQCISMIPGVSRSMSTIVGGMSQKLTRKNAAEFSFFLAVPTMAAATGLDVLELFVGGNAVGTGWATAHNLFLLAVGCAVAFIVALFAMRWFVSFLTKYGFRLFGWYRILVGGIILTLLFMGHSLVIFN